MKQDKKTYCLHCNGRTGYGFGIEPMRYDTICCSSKCANEIFKHTPIREKRV